MRYRSHEPIVISKFNGLWDRGNEESVPLDHFTDCANLDFIQNGIVTRQGIGISQDVAVPISNVRRIYNYPTPTANTLIVLAFDEGTNTGKVYHVVDGTTTYGPILSIVGMTDFAFVPYGGRAYISPFTQFTVGDLKISKGLQNEFLYVYTGDGTAARKAGGSPLVGALTIAHGAAGHTDTGFHLFAFVAETASGFNTAPGAITGFITAPSNSVSFGTVPTSGSPTILRRHLVATKKITAYNGDTHGYTFYFVPNATINNDTDAFLNNISFYDADLLDDASHLLESYSDIPAGSNLTLFHNRLVLGTTFDNIDLLLISTEGEPEAIDQIDGIIEVPKDGNPVTNVQELRDLMYVFKRSRTRAYTDNGENPIEWPMILVDNALGTSVHGIATVLDSGSFSVDFLIICTYQGVTLFNGKFLNPELSWKIEHYWKSLDRIEFDKIQIVNAPIQKAIYIALPTGEILMGNYSEGLDPMKIKWCPWIFDMWVNTVAIHNIDEIIFGSELRT